MHAWRAAHAYAHTHAHAHLVGHAELDIQHGHMRGRVAPLADLHHPLQQAPGFRQGREMANMQRSQLFEEMRGPRSSTAGGRLLGSHRTLKGVEVGEHPKIHAYQPMHYCPPDCS